MGCLHCGCVEEIDYYSGLCESCFKSEVDIDIKQEYYGELQREG